MKNSELTGTTEIEAALEALYTKGHSDGTYGQDYDPRACEEWQVALDLFNKEAEENDSDKLDEFYNGSCKRCED